MRECVGRAAESGREWTKCVERGWARCGAVRRCGCVRKGVRMRCESTDGDDDEEEVDAGGDEESGPRLRPFRSWLRGADSRRNHNCQTQRSDRPTDSRWPMQPPTPPINESIDLGQQAAVRWTKRDAQFSTHHTVKPCCGAGAVAAAVAAILTRRTAISSGCSPTDHPSSGSSSVGCQVSQNSPHHASTAHTHDAAKRSDAALPNAETAITHAALWDFPRPEIDNLGDE